MTKKNNIDKLSDTALVNMIAAFVKHHRLQQNKTQFTLAEEAGINRTTMVEFENGRSVNTITLIRLLRTLNLLHVFEAFKVELQPSPIQLAELEQARRKRASASKKPVKKSKTSW